MPMERYICNAAARSCLLFFPRYVQCVLQAEFAFRMLVSHCSPPAFMLLNTQVNRDYDPDDFDCLCLLAALPV